MNSFIYSMIVGANIGLVGMYLYNTKKKTPYDYDNVQNELRSAMLYKLICNN